MELSESDILANGMRLHVYRTATGKPPLVFAHGFSDNGLCFTPIAEQFADDYEIILYDSRGHGKSEASQTKATVIDRAEDLAGVVKALDLHKPVLMGHSMGAVTVALYAGLYPQAPGRIVLEDPPPFDRLAPVDAQAREARKAWHKIAIANKDRSTQELIEMNRLESPTWPEAERGPWAQSKQQISLTIFDEGDIDPVQGKQIVSQITCPVLLLTADAKLGAMFPADVADALVAGLPDARHVNIHGAGHSIRREQPAAFVKAVREFLQDTRMKYVLDPQQVEFWSLDRHTGVSAKLLADGQKMTVLYTTWASGARAPEHIHPHEQMGLCLQGEAVFTIDGQDYLVKAGQFYHIPGNTPHAERNDLSEPAILVDFFSPVREDLLRRRFEPKTLD